MNIKELDKYCNENNIKITYYSYWSCLIETKNKVYDLKIHNEEEVKKVYNKIKTKIEEDFNILDFTILSNEYNKIDIEQKDRRFKN
jgi:hypothetical protein